MMTSRLGMGKQQTFFYSVRRRFVCTATLCIIPERRPPTVGIQSSLKNILQKYAVSIVQLPYSLKIIHARESLVNDIPDGGGNIEKLFLRCRRFPIDLI